MHLAAILFLCQIIALSDMVAGKWIWAATWQNQQNECVTSKDSDQPGHSPSLIRVFTVRMKKAWFLGYPLSAQQRLWSDWANAQADLSLRWTHSHFVGFVMRRLKLLWHLKSEKLIWWIWWFEPSHEIMVPFVLRKLVLQTRIRSHPMGLHVWFLVGPFVYFQTSCVRTAKALMGPANAQSCLSLCWSPMW